MTRLSNYLVLSLIVQLMVIPSIMTDADTLTPSLGFWSDRDCILARFSIKFIIPMNGLDSKNDALEISLSPTAKVASDKERNDCSYDNDKYQTLTLLWRQEGEWPCLRNNVTFTFAKYDIFYGIRRIRGEFKLYNDSTFNEKTSPATLIVDTEPLYHMEQNHTLLFLTPSNDSYSCQAGSYARVNMFTTMVPFGNGLRLAKNKTSTLLATHFQFDAFRNATQNNHTSQFRRESYRPVDCIYDSEGFVAPVVSVPMAILVVFFVIFIISFIVSRRRNATPYHTFR